MRTKARILSHQTLGVVRIVELKKYQVFIPEWMDDYIKCVA